MYCPKCGDEINYKSKYCRKCGAKLPYNMEFNKEKMDLSSKVNSTLNKKIIFMALLGLVVIVLLFSYNSFFNHSSIAHESDSSYDDFINNYLTSSDEEEVEYTYYSSGGYNHSGDVNSSDFFNQLFGSESHKSSGENFSL